MISIAGQKITPTIFPDKTSQIWKLPDSIKKIKEPKITWDFEEERELIDLMSLALIYGGSKVYIPYLPYARQDKLISNNTTFNLEVLIRCINTCEFKEVRVLDPHSDPGRLSEIKNLVIDSPEYFQEEEIKKLKPDLLVFPDASACRRYDYLFYKYGGAIADKHRASNDGTIATSFRSDDKPRIKSASGILMIDDICDGGASFIELARIIRILNHTAKINLFITHGVFSKGLDTIRKNGIEVNWIYSVKTGRANEDTEPTISI